MYRAACSSAKHEQHHRQVIGLFDKLGLHYARLPLFTYTIRGRRSATILHEAK